MPNYRTASADDFGLSVTREDPQFVESQGSERGVLVSSITSEILGGRRRWIAKGTSDMPPTGTSLAIDGHQTFRVTSRESTGSSRRNRHPPESPSLRDHRLQSRIRNERRGPGGPAIVTS